MYRYNFTIIFVTGISLFVDTQYIVNKFPLTPYNIANFFLSLSLIINTTVHTLIIYSYKLHMYNIYS